MIIFASIACPDCAGKFAQKSCSKHGKKSIQIELEFLKKCLKFRNSARKLLVVFNYFLADVHKYSVFFKALTLDCLIGDQTTSETTMFSFFKIDCSHSQKDNCAFSLQHSGDKVELFKFTIIELLGAAY